MSNNSSKSNPQTQQTFPQLNPSQLDSEKTQLEEKLIKEMTHLNLDKQSDRLNRFQNLLDQIGQEGTMNAELQLEALMSEDINGLLDHIIASNNEALQECDEMDKYLDQIKASIDK